MVRAAQFSCCSAKLHFFNSYDQAAQWWTNWLQYKIYVVIRHQEYELQVSNIEEIKQQLADFRQIIKTAFERRDFRVSAFLQVEQRH